MSEFLIIFVCLFSFILGRYFYKIKNIFLKKKNLKKRDDDLTKTKQNTSFDEDDDLKMVFLVRQDLKMGAGKIAAQVAHAAIGLYDDILEEDNIYQKTALNYWFNFGQKKIVLKVDNLNIMLDAVKKCKKLKLKYCLITDAGHTQIPEGSVTVLGIGPDTSEKINTITGTFKSMN